MLDVRGMKCGGCSAAVKRILLTCPDVQGASVNLLTECAVLKLPAVLAHPEGSTLQKATQLLTSKVRQEALPLTRHGHAALAANLLSITVAATVRR